jgi:hypothetical protein
MLGWQMVVRPEARRTTTPRASLRTTTPSSPSSGSPEARLPRILTRAPTGKSVTTRLLLECDANAEVDPTLRTTEPGR